MAALSQRMKRPLSLQEALAADWLKAAFQCSGCVNRQISRLQKDPRMIYRPLGHSGLQVSALTLGSMMFGEQTSTEDALRIIDKAWDQGINFIDTADVYNAGRSEEIVGEAVARNRQDWIVASKVGFGPADGLPNRSGLSRKHLFNAMEATLTRMGTDYLDIYYLHREDHNTPLEETVRPSATCCARARSATGACPTSAAGASPRSATLPSALACPSRWSASRCTTSSTARPSPSNSPPRQTMAWAWCPSARWPGRAQRQVCAGRRAGRRQPRRAPGQTHHGSGMAPGVAGIAQQIQRMQRPGCGHRRVRHCLGAEQPMVSSAIVGPRTEEQWDTYGGALAVKIPRRMKPSSIRW
jgi:hypothetical protein